MTFTDLHVRAQNVGKGRQHWLTYRFELFNLFLRLQVPKLLQESNMGGKGARLKEVEQTEQLLNTVLKRSACEEDPVLKVKSP